MGAQEQIRIYFSFDQADLDANRLGQFSVKQKQKLDNLAKGTNRFIWVLLILDLGGLVWSIISAIQSDGSWTKWIGPVFLLAVAIWLFSGTRNKIDQTIEKAEGVVKFVLVHDQTGSVTDFDSERITVESYQMFVGNKIFENANPALIPHMQDDVYAVYYTNSTRQILSAELISKSL